MDLRECKDKYIEDKQKLHLAKWMQEPKWKRNGRLNEWIHY